MFDLPEDFDLEDDEPTRIKIIGVGLIGNSYLTKVQSLELSDVDTLSVMNDKNFDAVEDFLKDVDILLVASKAGDNLAKKIAEYMKKLDMPIVIAITDSQYDAEFAKKKEAIAKNYQTKLQEIDKSITATIASQAKLKGYDMVITKGTVLYGGDDITQDIIKVVK